jgi:hypothetical protein
MQSFTLGAGLAALAFWGFIASVVVAGIWYDIRKREAQHETVRRLVESGKPLDSELVEKLLSLSGNREARPDRDFKLVGMILLPTAVGLALLGMVLGMQFEEWRLPLLGVAGLVLCVGLGFLLTANMASNWYRPQGNEGLDRL